MFILGMSQVNAVVQSVINLADLNVNIVMIEEWKMYNIKKTVMFVFMTAAFLATGLTQAHTKCCY